MKTIYRTAFSTLIAGSMAWGTVLAGPFSGIHPLQSDRFSVGVGAFFSNADGDLYLDQQNRDDGTDVDLQDDLGMEDSETLPAVAFNWRLSNKSRVQAEYFSFGQSGRRNTSERIEWGDLDFEVGAEVRSDLDLDVVRGFFGYSFIKDERKELGAGLGLHYLRLDASLAGNATIAGIPVLNVERGFDDWAILPNIGGFGNYAFSDKWLASGRVDWISADIDSYDGQLWNVEVAVQYQAFEHFGVGLAYRYLDFELNANKSNGDWGGDLEYNGPLLFVTANF